MNANQRKLCVYGLGYWPEEQEDWVFRIFEVKDGESEESAINRAKEEYGEDMEYIIK